MKFKTLTELFRNKRRWTQETSARNARGRPVSPTGRAAVRWCMFGAIELVYRRRQIQAREIVRAETGLGVVEWNDDPDTTIAESPRRWTQQ